MSYLYKLGINIASLSMYITAKTKIDNAAQLLKQLIWINKKNNKNDVLIILVKIEISLYNFITLFYSYQGVINMKHRHLCVVKQKYN